MHQACHTIIPSPYAMWFALLKDLSTSSCSVLRIEPISPYLGAKFPPLWLADAVPCNASTYKTLTRFLNRLRKVGMRDMETTIPCNLKTEKSNKTNQVLLLKLL